MTAQSSGAHFRPAAANVAGVSRFVFVGVCRWMGVCVCVRASTRCCKCYISEHASGVKTRRGRGEEVI